MDNIGISEELIISINDTKHGVWLNDYKTYGEKSYVFNNKDIWNEFIQSRSALNDIDVSDLVLQYALNNDAHIGKVFGNIYGIGEANWSNLPTLMDICDDEAACIAIFNHPVATTAILGYNDYEIVDYKKDVLYTVLNTKPTLLNEIINSDKYKSKLLSKTTSYNDYCILTTCVSNKGQNEYRVHDYYYVYSFCKSGLNYTNIDNSKTIICEKQGVGGARYLSSNLNEGTKYEGYTSNPYTNTSYTVNKIVKNIILESGNYTYSHRLNGDPKSSTSTSGGTINYIPL